MPETSENYIELCNLLQTLKYRVERKARSFPSPKVCMAVRTSPEYQAAIKRFDPTHPTCVNTPSEAYRAWIEANNVIDKEAQG